MVLASEYVTGGKENRELEVAKSEALRLAHQCNWISGVCYIQCNDGSRGVGLPDPSTNFFVCPPATLKTCNHFVQLRVAPAESPPSEP